MEKPSVTLRHDEGYLLGGLLLIMTALVFGMSLVVPVAQQTGLISVWVVILLVLCSIACFFWGSFTETFDENGIFIKRPFCSKQYHWSDVTKVSIKAVPAKGGKMPEFSIEIKNRRFSLSIAYTKRTMACIIYYYGQPDRDQWGKPPMLM